MLVMLPKVFSHLYKSGTASKVFQCIYNPVLKV